MSEATIHDILAQFRDEELHNRHLGDRFERLICRYLELDPQYSERFSNVWLWNEWPRKGEVGDIGIDIVAEEEATGDIVGIQCKFYLPDHQLSKGDIDKFLATLGKKQFASGIIVSTTDKWGPNVEHTIKDQSKPIQKLRVQDLDASPVDWSTFSLEAINKLKLQKKRKPRPHSRAALDDVKAGFEAYDRGKLIMACGTGKTYTSLCLAEEIALGGNVLFLVPSLALLSQALREWTAHSAKPIHALAVCSDANIGRRKEKDGGDNPDIDVTDLAFPATTDTKSLIRQWQALQRKIKNRKQSKENRGTTVVFSTYHSIASVHEAQKAGLPDFDLVICDEAHRTTGVTLSDQDESHFVKIHDNHYIRAAKRLYMTATPRVYGDEAKSKAGEADATLCSMDDEATFGPEFHRLGFGEAVEKNLLSDYKVLVLAVDESYAAKTFQKQITDSDNSLNLDDAVRITGCWNGLAKKLDHTTTDEAELFGDLAPMRTAVAFSRSIANSKAFCDYFTELVAAYKTDHPNEENLLDIDCDHVDGGMNAITRSQKLDWLKEPGPALRCRVLSNARCLSEGVDVPSLDAVMFLNPRNSVVDVVQSVGRVMRKATNKQYGYIILPIGIPAGISPEEALKDNKKYAVVWQVLQALRSHDDRFNATINQIELNKKPPAKIGVIGVGGDGDGNDGSKSDGDGKDKLNDKKKGGQGTFDFLHNLQEWKDALYARIVKKCGERRPWEKWSEDIARIAQRHIDRLNLLLDKDPDVKVVNAFAKFIAGLHRNINPAITREEAIEMLAQHLITKPVFDALFENYAFSEHNPVSQAMQIMADALQGQALDKETETLEKFYASVRKRAQGIDNAEGKQKVILELYDKFFSTAFKKMSERLGIVYTPVEIVDFIIHSVEDVLRQEFQSSLTAKDVHIIDPFTGTGTFITRLLQSGLIKPEDLHRKFTQELHANEIVLLAYYIAAINIEETFHTLQLEAHRAKYEGKEKVPEPLDYIPFDGIVLTDTFQLTEAASSQSDMEDAMFPVNNKRVTRQKKAPIRVIIANPPYSAGQGSANDNNQNLEYPLLDRRIEETFAAHSTATLKNSLYDSYIRAIRWASDRIADRGIIGFVTNGYFIDSRAMDGLRACLANEFTSLYIFNLRGNQRTSGELSRQEGGKIFGSGSRTPVAISILVRNPDKPTPGELFYHDIGDYMSREEKLKIVADFSSINGLHQKNKWQRIKPNADADWINQRNPNFEQFLALAERESGSVFLDYSNGVKTNRDSWVYSLGRQRLADNVRKLIKTYTEESARISKITAKGTPLTEKAIQDAATTDPTLISWSTNLLNRVRRNEALVFDEAADRIVAYRPFTKIFHYYDRQLVDRPGRHSRFYPTLHHSNMTICVSGIGTRAAFSILMSDCLPDLSFADISSGSQCFPLYIYEKAEVKDGELALSSTDDDGEIIDGYRRKSAITDGILAEFRKAYGKGVSKEDVFYYVYGILHSPEYRERFAADLKKMLPRIPLTKETPDYQKFTQAGRDLANWHLNYETIDPHPAVHEETGDLGLNPWELYQVRKMTFARPTAAQKAAGEKWDKTRIIYNSKLTLTGIPLEAYDYIVNGKPALEWIMERYQLSKDPKSGITNDPNDWCKEHNNPRYIVDLIKRVTRVSIETNRIVASLPALNEK